MSRLFLGLYMCLYQLCIFLLVISFNLFAEEKRLEDILPTHSPRVIDFEWEERILEMSPLGIPSHVRYFYDSHPMSEHLFSEEGFLWKQCDLDYDGKTTYPEGISLTYGKEGTVIEIAPYHLGQLDGWLYRFSAAGTLIEKVFYQQGKEEGLSVRYFQNGSKKEEIPYVQGQISGDLIGYLQEGNRAYLIPYINGKKEGKALRWYPDGSLYSISYFKEDKLTNSRGEPALTLFREDRSLWKVQEFVDGMEHGLLITYHPNGREEMKVHYKEGQMEGAFFEKAEDGTLLAEGNYHRGIPVGLHYKKHRNGRTCFEINFSDKGEPLSSVEVWDEEGKKISFAPYKEGKLDGVALAWDPNGQLLEESGYEKGFLEGEQKLYHSCGKLKKRAFFTQGKGNGKVEVWDPDGRLREELIYDLGKLLSWKEWYSNGVLRLHKTFLNEKLHGLSEEFFEDGSLSAQCSYENGLTVGPAIFHQEDGSRVELFYNKEGKIDGSLQVYHADGSLAQEKDFRQNSVLKEVRTYYSKSEAGAERCLKEIARFDSEGRFDGEQKGYHINGLLGKITHYSHGLKEGLCASFDLSGQVMQEAWYRSNRLHGSLFKRDPDQKEWIIHYVNGQKTGSCEHFFNDGQKRQILLESYYDKGLLEGVVREFSIEGKLIAATFYKEGKKEGRALLYSPKGEIIHSAYFKNDKLEGAAESFYPDGSTKERAFYLDGLLHGEKRRFYPNGAVELIECYQNGLLDGVLETYSQEGVRLFFAEFSNGKRSGAFHKYYPSGAIQVEQYYDQDVRLSRKIYDKDGRSTETTCSSH